MNKLPTTVKTLNNWIDTNFITIYGPSRDYFGLSFNFSIGMESISYEKRIVFSSYAFTGLQEDCCVGIANIMQAAFMPITGVANPELLADAIVPLFIRSSFEWEPETNILFGRLAFWDDKLNNYLKASPAYKPEVTLPRKAPRNE